MRHLRILLLWMLLASSGFAEGNRVQDLAWLAGNWTGRCFGGSCEEVWAEPAGGTMIGMFRLVKDGKPVFYEFLTIKEENRKVVLKLKHFHPDLTGWEEKTETVNFTLLRADSQSAEFEGLVFRKLEDGSMKIELRLKDKSTGEVRTEEMRFQRN